MTIPVSTTATSAAQAAQQKSLDDAAQQKKGASKFDEKLQQQGAESTRGTQNVEQAQRAQGVVVAQRAEATRKADQVRRSEHAELGLRKSAELQKRGEGELVQQILNPNPVDAPHETSAPVKFLANALGGVEQNQNVMNQIVKLALSGKELTPQELLAVQAKVFQYSQELELTGKVVEKATTGLKDTLKTQV
jgi:hypothetical protein